MLTFGRRGVVGAFLADYLGIRLRSAGPEQRSPRDDGAAPDGAADPALVRGGRPRLDRPRRRSAPAWRVFGTITLPLALPGVIAGMVLGFAKAIGEFGATITFVSNMPGETETLSPASTPRSRSRAASAGEAALRVSIVLAFSR